jgi:hypothetical protein
MALGLIAMLIGTLTVPFSGSAAAGGRTEIASSTSGFGNVATDGRFVVWGTKNDARDLDIYAYDVQSEKTFPVATGPAIQSLMGVNDGTVDWIERDAGAPESDWKLMAKRFHPAKHATSESGHSDRMR